MTVVLVRLFLVLLIPLLPIVIRHAVDDLAGFRIAERDALLLGRRAVPLGQAVAAKAGQVHEIEVLHVGALAQMRDQVPKRRSLELRTRLVVHATPPIRARRSSNVRRRAPRSNPPPAGPAARRPPPHPPPTPSAI